MKIEDLSSMLITIIEKAFTNHTADVSHPNCHDKIHVMSYLEYHSSDHFWPLSATISSFAYAEVHFHLSGEIMF